jgi:hypothetical protein
LLWIGLLRCIVSAPSEPNSLEHIEQ